MLKANSILVSNAFMFKENLYFDRICLNKYKILCVMSSEMFETLALVHWIFLLKEPTVITIFRLKQPLIPSWIFVNDALYNAHTALRSVGKNAGSAF